MAPASAEAAGPAPRGRSSTTAGSSRRVPRTARGRRRPGRRPLPPSARAGGHLASRRAGPARAAPRRTGWPGRRPRARPGCPSRGPRATPAPGRPAATREQAGSRGRAASTDRPALDRAALRGQRAHPVHRPGQRELRGPEALHEVAAAALPGVLHGPQDRVDGGEPARHALGGHRAAQQDPVPVQQGPGQGVQPPGRVGVGGRHQGPAPGDRGRPGPAGHGGPAEAAPARSGPGGRARPGHGCSSGGTAADAAQHRPPRAQHGAQRGQRVVAEPPGPHQVPDGRGHRGVTGQRPVLLREQRRSPVREHPEEHGAAAIQRAQDRLMHYGHRNLAGRGEQERRGVRRRQHDPAVPAGQAARAGPRHLARRRELIQHGRLVARHPARQDQGLQRRRRHRGPGQLVDHLVDQRRGRPAGGRPAGPGIVRSGRWLPRVLPGGQERGQRGRGHRFRLLAQLGQAAPAQQAEHRGVAPLRSRAGRAGTRPRRSAPRRPGGGASRSRPRLPARTGRRGRRC